MRRRPVVGRAGADPAGIAFIAEGGLHWIGYQSNPYPVALEGPKFEDYLRDEGLERIIDVGGAGSRAFLSLREGVAGHARSRSAVCYAVVIDNATNDGRFIAAAEYKP